MLMSRALDLGGVQYFQFGEDLLKRVEEKPWQVGLEMAREFRCAFGLPQAPLDDTVLCDLLGLTPAQLSGATSPSIPLSFAVPARTGQKMYLYLRDQHSYGRRFDAARLFVAFNLADPGNFLLASDARTVIQVVQRAFASELLAPMEAVRDFAKGDLSPSVAEEAAEHFKISPVALQYHIMNAGD
jgi:hypothetical protein